MSWGRLLWCSDTLGVAPIFPIENRDTCGPHFCKKNSQILPGPHPFTRDSAPYVGRSLEYRLLLSSPAGPVGEGRTAGRRHVVSVEEKTILAVWRIRLRTDVVVYIEFFSQGLGGFHGLTARLEKFPYVGTRSSSTSGSRLQPAPLGDADPVGRTHFSRNSRMIHLHVS